jgi:hypothetical protein
MERMFIGIVSDGGRIFLKPLQNEIKKMAGTGSYSSLIHPQHQVFICFVMPDHVNISPGMNIVVI